MSFHSPRVVLPIAAAYAALVLWATLGPVPWAQTRLAENPLGILNPATWSSPTTWTTGSPVEFVLNIALFVPVGALAYRLRGRAPKIVVPIAFTVLIELLQIPLATRASDPRDLVANVLGALVGLTLARNLATRSGEPSTRRSRSPV